jgi:hypothetical protein
MPTSDNFLSLLTAEEQEQFLHALSHQADLLARRTAKRRVKTMTDAALPTGEGFLFNAATELYNLTRAYQELRVMVIGGAYRVLSESRA